MACGYLRFLIIANERCQIQLMRGSSSRTNWIAKTLNIALSPFSYKNPPLHYISFKA